MCKSRWGVVFIVSYASHAFVAYKTRNGIPMAFVPFIESNIIGGTLMMLWWMPKNDNIKDIQVIDNKMSVF